MSPNGATPSAPTARRAATIALLAAVGFAPSLAHAGGQCDALSVRRNAIYKAAGYCFKTAAQIRIFGNAGCQYDNQFDVPLSARQRAEIAAILRDERYFGCR